MITKSLASDKTHESYEFLHINMKKQARLATEDASGKSHFLVVPHGMGDAPPQVGSTV